MTLTQWISVLVPLVAIVIAHLLSRSHLQRIQVNVDGNLHAAIEKVEASAKMIAELRKLIAEQVTASANQAQAIANLTTVVDKNGGAYRRSTDIGTGERHD